MNSEQQILSAYQSAYIAARSEIIERLKLRDQAFYLYLAAVSTIYGIGVGKDKINELLLIIPFLSLGVASILAQHNITIGAIASYIRTDLNGYFLNVSHWDNSTSLRRVFRHQSLFRKISSYITIGIPPVVSLIINKDYALKTTFPFGLLWWICLTLTIIAIYYLYYSNTKRDKIYASQFDE